MQFNLYASSYQRYKKAANQERLEVKPLDEFYRTALGYLVDKYAASKSVYLPFSINHMSTEHRWWHKGRPYYNFHPSLVPVFGRSKLNFPCSYIEFPYDTLVIQFGEKDPNLLLPDGVHYVKSCIVTRTDKIVADLDKILFTDPEARRYDHLNKRLAIWMDIGETIETEWGTEILHTYRQVAWEHGDTTVEEALIFLPDDDSLNYGVQVGEEISRLVVKLVVSLAFLSKDDSPIIIPHILKKDENAYFEGNEETQQRLAKKAWEKREQVGFLVGSREMFDLGFIGPATKQPTGEIGVRELQYANIVSGHWQLFRYGPGREHGRMRWVMPYVRNKDKPFKH